MADWTLSETRHTVFPFSTKVLPQEWKRQPGRDRPTLPQWGWCSRTITSWKLRFRTRTAQTTAEPFILVLFLVLWQFVRKQVDRRWWAVADDTANGKWENGKQRPLMPLCKTPAHREHLTAVGLMAKKVNVHEATYVAREVNNGQTECACVPVLSYHRIIGSVARKRQLASH